MSGIPPLPPLRIKEADGSPNVIPVFEITASNMTVINQGGGRVTLDAAGGTGPAGPAGTLTIGSGITGGASDGFLLMVSNGATLGQVNSSSFQRAIAFPVNTNSGGTGLNSIGSAHTILGVNSSEASLTYYAILASNNAVVTKVGTSIFITANTVNIAGKQDSISIPLIVTSGGSGLSTAGSGTMLVGMNSSGVVYDYYILLGSNSTTVTRSGSSYIISTITSGATGGGNGVVSPGSAGNLAYYVNAGTAVDDLVIGSAHTILGVNSSEASHTYYAILASNNATVTKVGTSIFISANTAAQLVYAATGNKYIVTDLAGDLTAELRLVQSGNSITVDTSNNVVTINATTNPVVVYAPTGGNYIAFAADVNLTSEKVLTASNNITLTTDNTTVWISANTGAGGGSGTVNTGSQNYLAYYPSAGTTVDDTTVSVSTGNGVAPFSVTILTSPAASVASGDFWFQSSSNVMYLAIRSSNVTYLVAMAS